MPARFLFDLHVHSTGSPDSSLSPGWAMTRARELGLRGIAFTDHDRLTLLESPFKDLLLVPGTELSTEEGDLLALGVRELPPAGLPLPELIDRIHRQGGVAVAPHPFSSAPFPKCLGDHLFEIIDRLDGIEVTSPRRTADNRKARRVAQEHGKAAVGGSDAHSPQEMGRGFTTCEEGSIEGLLDAIRKGRTGAVIRRLP